MLVLYGMNNFHSIWFSRRIISTTTLILNKFQMSWEQKGTLIFYVCSLGRVYNDEELFVQAIFDEIYAETYIHVWYMYVYICKSVAHKIRNHLRRKNEKLYSYNHYICVYVYAYTCIYINVYVYNHNLRLLCM